MPPPPHRSAARRAETWLLTGPLGHLIGGALDLAQAVTPHLLAWIRRQMGR